MLYAAKDIYYTNYAVEDKFVPFNPCNNINLRNFFKNSANFFDDSCNFGHKICGCPPIANNTHTWSSHRQWTNHPRPDKLKAVSLSSPFWCCSPHQHPHTLRFIAAQSLLAADQLGGLVMTQQCCEAARMSDNCRMLGYDANGSTRVLSRWYGHKFLREK